jgi:hypothetical protein
MVCYLVIKLLKSFECWVCWWLGVEAARRRVVGILYKFVLYIV